jgi:hypothetical protein
MMVFLSHGYPLTFRWLYDASWFMRRRDPRIKGL